MTSPRGDDYVMLSTLVRTRSDLTAAYIKYCMSKKPVAGVEGQYSHPPCLLLQDVSGKSE